ncbi:hypothetical protein EZS27_014963 [termite gut metagenome]|jgi:hypothetical protein|uniref:Uncharacterized protein n=1 Tax=termite gut metagenome TaxID=433724 RepID=A0A5J4RVG9_9ZZZZ
MKYLKSIWAERIPNYSSNYQQIFDKLANKGNGDNEERAKETGRVFATQYELYIYAFFLGLYSNEQQERTNKVDFGHKISEWGKKNRKTGRESFIEIQDFIFISLITKCDVDFILLERSPNEEAIKIAISQLVDLMESYINGGLQLIKDKLEDDENYFISSAEAPMNFLLSKISD